MLPKVVVWCLLVHLVCGQQQQNPFLFDLPPLRLEPLQIRLNPTQSSPSLILLNQNQSIPIETMPPNANPFLATTQPQPQTQLPRPQTFTSFAPLTRSSNQVSNSQTPLVPLAFQQFQQLRPQTLQTQAQPRPQTLQTQAQPRPQTLQTQAQPRHQTLQIQEQPQPQTLQTQAQPLAQTFQSQAQPQQQTAQRPQALRSQIRPFVFGSTAPQIISSTPNLVQQFWPSSLTQPSAQPQSQPQAQPVAAVQPTPSSSTNRATANDKNNVPKESSVTFENGFNSVVQDLSNYVPLQLPGQFFVLNQAQAQQTGQQPIQGNDPNTQFLPPVVLPAVNLPVDELIRMVAIDFSQQQAVANNQVQPVQAAPQLAQPVTAPVAQAAPQPAPQLFALPAAQPAPAPPTAAPQPPPQQQPLAAPTQAQVFQPISFQAPTQTVSNQSPQQVSASSATAAAPVRTQQSFKPLSFRTVPFQTLVSQKQSNEPKAQVLTAVSDTKPNAIGILSQHLTFGQAALPVAAPAPTAQPTQSAPVSPPVAPPVAPPAVRPVQRQQQHLEFGTRLKQLK